MSSNLYNNRDSTRGTGANLQQYQTLLSLPDETPKPKTAKEGAEQIGLKVPLAEEKPKPEAHV